MTRTQRIPLVALIAFPSLPSRRSNSNSAHREPWRGPPVTERSAPGGVHSQAERQDSSQLILAGVGVDPLTDTTLGGSGNTVPSAAALDPAGNVWIVGYTDSDDLTLVNPILVAQKRSAPRSRLRDETRRGRRRNIVRELSQGWKAALVNAVLLEPPQPPSQQTIPVTSMSAGPPGSAGLPVSGGINGCYPSADSFGDSTFCSFLMKFSSSGKLVYSTLVTTGGGGEEETGGASCIGRKAAYASVSSMAVDSEGAVIIAGSLGSSYNTQLHYSFLGGGYICRVASDGSRLLWMNGTPTTNGIATSVFAAQDLTGNIYLFGVYIPFTDRRTPSPLLPAPPVSSSPNWKADGSAVTWYRDLGQATNIDATGLLLDRQGNAYLVGTTSSAQFPQTASGVPKLGSDFVLELDPSGSQVQPPLRLPRGVIASAAIIRCKRNS